MKKIFLAVFFLCGFSLAANCPVSPSEEGPVSYYGKLKAREGLPFIDGVKEGRDDIKLVQLRGVSFFWSQWSGQFYNAAAVERLAKDWKAEVVRAAFGSTGNLSSSEVGKIKTVVDAAIDNDVYVIIDWHSHNVASNEAETERAKEFFAEMARIYGDCDNVIFELYNEPVNVNWARIKTYAEAVIPEIRAYSDNLILVGTPNYSQQIESVIDEAINDKNVGYVLHFYAASHPLSNWRNNIDKALNKGLPIFVTEYGTTSADGGCSPEVTETCKVNNYNSHSAANADQWHTYMDQKRISSAAWSVFDKYEGSAFFGTVPNGTFDQNKDSWIDTTKMTEAGKYIFRKLNYYYECVPYNPSPSTRCSTPVKPAALVGSFNFDFFGGASLAVSLPQPGNAVLEVFSLKGQKIGELFNEYQNAGDFQFSFAELGLKSGVYIFSLRQNNAIKTKILRISK